MSCKSCSDVTLLSGSDGNGVQTVVDNGNGTFTFFFTDGSTFTTPDFSGSAGAAATLAVGTVTTGAPGTAPTVTNTGSSSAAVFAFQFPIGIGHDNTLFVDLVFGAGAGIRERIDKPWNTIAAAITAATAGDTVHIRAGSYTEDITLKNGVDIHCEEGVTINGKITDAGVLTVCNLTGNAILIDTEPTNQCIEITGANSDIELHFRRITNTGTGIYQKPVLNNNKLLVETDVLSGSIQNYFVSARGASYCTVIVNQYAESAASTTGAFAGVDVRQAFSGEMNFKCPKMTIGTGSNVESGRALSIEGDTTSTAKVYFEVDSIVNNHDLATSSKAYGTLNANGDGKYIINVKDCYSKSKEGLVVGGSDVTGTPTSATGVVIFEGMIFSRDNAAFRMFGVNNVATTTRAVIRNSSLMRGVDPDAAAGITTADRNSVIIFGDAGFGTTSLFASNYMNAEFIDTQIIKNVDITIPATGGAAMDPSTDNAAVCIQGGNNKIYFKGCDIVNGIENQTPISSDCVASFSAVNTRLVTSNTVPALDVYFKDTHSNRNKKAQVSGTNSTSGTTLTDGSKNFTILKVQVGDLVRNNSTGATTTVTVVGTTTVTLAAAGTFPGTGVSYTIYGVGAINETNTDATGFVTEASARTLNYLHKS